MNDEKPSFELLNPVYLSRTLGKCREELMECGKSKYALRLLAVEQAMNQLCKTPSNFVMLEGYIAKAPVPYNSVDFGDCIGLRMDVYVITKSYTREDLKNCFSIMCRGLAKNVAESLQISDRIRACGFVVNRLNHGEGSTNACHKNQWRFTNHFTVISEQVEIMSLRRNDSKKWVGKEFKKNLNFVNLKKNTGKIKRTPERPNQTPWHQKTTTTETNADLTPSM